MKGFFSVFTVALSVFLLALLAGASLSLLGLQNAAQADLQAKVVSDRFDDASAMFNATVLDAMLDYSYGSFGCAPVYDSDFCGGAATPSTVLSGYLANAEAGLSVDGPPLTFSPSQITVACAAGTPGTVTLDGFNYQNYSVSATVPFSVNSSNARRSAFRGFNWTVYVAPSAGPGTVFRVRVNNESAPNSLLKNVTVSC